MTARYIPQRRLSENIHHRLLQAQSAIEYYRIFALLLEKNKDVENASGGDSMRNLFIRVAMDGS